MSDTAESSDHSGSDDVQSSVLDRQRGPDIKTAPIEVVYENRELYVQCFTCSDSVEGSSLPVSLVRLHSKVVQGFNPTPGVFEKDRLSLDLNGSGPTVSIYDGYIDEPKVEKNCDSAFSLRPDKVNGLYRIRYSDLRDIIKSKSPEYAGISLLWACPGQSTLEFR
jgi:hypothetical protein